MTAIERGAMSESHGLPVVSWRREPGISAMEMAGPTMWT
jgi:hypothetical protein